MHKSRQLLIEAKSIGSIAIDVLSKDQAGLVISSISRGIYIKSASRWLIFISCESFRSPLTITLKEAIPLTNPIQAGTTVHFASKQLLFPEAGIKIAANDHSVWKPASRGNSPAIRSDRKERLNYFAKEALLRKQGVGFCSLLPGLLELSAETQPINQALVPIYENIILLQQYFQEGKLPLVGKILCDFLGFGEGLTPSGDDYVIGTLLSLNRWKDVLFPNEDLGGLNQQVVEAAYQATTSLSANLIECATLGQGDERLIDAIDYLMCGSIQEDEIMTNLLNWGNSSGADTFAGMATALSAMDTDQEVGFLTASA